MKRPEAQPNKIKRRELFALAESAAGLIRDTIERTRPPGKRASRREVTYTDKQAQTRQQDFLDLLGAADSALPLVTLQLIANPEAKVRDDNLTVDIETFPEGTSLPMAAGALAIMATGLNKFVVTEYEGRELSAGPDQHYEEISRFFTAHRLPLQSTVAYRRAANTPPQETNLLSGLDTVDPQ